MSEVQIVESPLKCRSALAELCNDLGIVEAAVVGIDRADFACDFLYRWHGKTLWCIDPFDPYPEMNFDRTADLVVAATRLAPYGWRAKIIRDKSPWAIQHIPATIPLGFVYLDGDHTYEAVKCDINAWHERLEGRGLIAGHDFCEATPGVMQAVIEFAQDIKEPVYRIHDPIWAPSWYIQL